MRGRCWHSRRWLSDPRKRLVNCTTGFRWTGWGWFCACSRNWHRGGLLRRCRTRRRRRWRRSFRGSRRCWIFRSRASGWRERRGGCIRGRGVGCGWWMRRGRKWAPDAAGAGGGGEGRRASMGVGGDHVGGDGELRGGLYRRAGMSAGRGESDVDGGLPAGASVAGGFEAGGGRVNGAECRSWGHGLARDPGRGGGFDGLGHAVGDWRGATSQGA